MIMMIHFFYTIIFIRFDSKFETNKSDEIEHYQINRLKLRRTRFFIFLKHFKLQRIVYTLQKRPNCESQIFRERTERSQTRTVIEPNCRYNVRDKRKEYSTCTCNEIEALKRLLTEFAVHT